MTDLRSVWVLMGGYGSYEDAGNAPLAVFAEEASGRAVLVKLEDIGGRANAATREYRRERMAATGGVGLGEAPALRQLRQEAELLGYALYQTYELVEVEVRS